MLPVAAVRLMAKLADQSSVRDRGVGGLGRRSLGEGGFESTRPRPNLSGGLRPAGPPYTLSRTPLRRRAPFAWLTRSCSFAPDQSNFDPVCRLARPARFILTRLELPVYAFAFLLRFIAGWRHRSLMERQRRKPGLADHL
jgi:hypothetical protein